MLKTTAVDLAGADGTYQGEVALVQLTETVIRFLDDDDSLIAEFHVDTFAVAGGAMWLDLGKKLMLTADAVAQLQMWADLPSSAEMAIAERILDRPVTAAEVTAALRSFENATAEGLDRVVTAPIADAAAVTAALEGSDAVTILIPRLVDASLREIAERNDVPVAMVRDLYAEVLGEDSAARDFRISEI